MGEMVIPIDPRDSQPIMEAEGEIVAGRQRESLDPEIEGAKVIVGEGDSDLAKASSRDTDKFNREKIAAEMAKRKAAQEAAATRAEVERQILGYLAGDRPPERYDDECPTPVCVPKFEIDINEFDDDEVTPVEIPMRKFFDSVND